RDLRRSSAFDVVLFWSLDRFSREGAFATLQHLNRLTGYGVQFRSFTEQYIDSCGIFAEAVISILAVLAQQERERISERTKAGLERARREGTRLGRPLRIVDREKIRSARAAGRSYASIAAELGVSIATVSRRLQIN
ncbi:MAG TPA: resolvase, partial [Solibacterales bacterium]|nr:resolvase [Bryobacterales bacterium]